MRNDLILGISCCFIGSYNFWSFYQQDKLYIFNFSFYISTFLIGVMFLFKARFTYQNIQSQIQASSIPQRIYEKNIPSPTDSPIFVQEVPANSKKYLKIKSHLITLMKGQGNNYSIQKINSIKNEKIKTKFKNYQSEMTKSFKCEGLQGPANTNYNFHGTKKSCPSDPCTGSEWKDCALCSIIKNGFQIKFSGKGASTDLRFGNGIYFSPDIEKALNYANTNGKILLLICKVVMGKVYYAKDSDSHLEEFNENVYHSIYGDPRVTLHLKQSEICVFKEEACWPKYLVEFNNK